MKVLGEIGLGAETWSTPLWLEERALIVAAARDGRVSAWRPDGSCAWVQQVGDVVTASPNRVRVGSDTYVVIGSHDGWLTSIDGSTGSTLWRRYLGSMIRATVAIVEGPLVAQGPDATGAPQLFVASYGDWLWRIDAATGDVRWKRWLPRHVWARGRGVVSSPIAADVDDDGRLEIVVGTRSWRLFCLDAETGVLRWWRPFDYGIDSTCTLAEIDGSPTLLIGTGESLSGPGDCSIVALRGSDGGIRWRARVGGGVDSSATCFRSRDGVKVVQTSLADAGCHCVDLATGRVEWSFHMGPTELCTHADKRCVLKGSDGYFTERARCRSYTVPLVQDFNGDGELEVLVGSMNGFLYLLDAQTGAPQEQIDTQAPVRGSPIQADTDGDGLLELIVPSGDRLLLYKTHAVGADWPMFKGHPSLAGVFSPGQPAFKAPGRSRRLPMAGRLQLLRAWAISDFGYFLRTRIDKHVRSRMGRRRMVYWY